MNNSNKPTTRFQPNCFSVFILIVICIGLMANFAKILIEYDINKALIGRARSQAHDLSLALYSYAADPIHADTYPQGKSSTEVFQKLFDAKILTEPTAVQLNQFRTEFKPYSGSIVKIVLKPENVGWDVTGGCTLETPKTIPLVYSTGFLVSYQAGKPSVLLDHSRPISINFSSSMIISYSDLSIAVLQPDASGKLTNFVSSDFDPQGKSYQQLAPYGSPK